MRGSFHINTGGDGAPLDWVIQTNTVNADTSLSPAQRINAARNSGAWQAVRLADCVLSPGVSMTVPIPVLPLPLQIHAMVFTVSHGTSEIQVPVVWEVELQRGTNGGAWETSVYPNQYQILPGSLMDHRSINGATLDAGRSYRLAVTVNAYDIFAQDVTPWILGVFSHDF